MLEKNKDYLEMRVSSTDCAFIQNASTTISIKGFSYDTSFRLPDPGESYVIVSKEKFEKLQESVVYYMALSTRAQYWKDKCELAKQFEKNYNLLLEKTGFTSVVDLNDYICDPSMTSPEDKTLKEIIDECEKDYISERDKAEALQTENEQLKKKLQVPDPFAEYKELLEKLHSKEDVEKFEWTLNHICGGKASANGWMVTAKLWRRNYETLSKLIGFSSTEEIQDYLTNEAECDTLQEAISKLKDQVKYTCDEWYSANSSNNSWKAAAECNSPKELIEKLNLLRDDISGRSTVIERYKRDIEKWQKVTGCPTPEAAKALIESGMAYEHGYHEVQEENRKLTEEVDSWKNVTGYSTPEDYMHARISGAFHTPFDYTAAWQKATGCDTPENAMKLLSELRDKRTHIVYLNDPLGVITKWERVTGYDRPEDFLKWKANIEGIIEAWKSGTGCKYPAEARILLEKWKVLTKCETPEAAATWITSYESACERGNELAEGAAEREKEWQAATGCDTPEEAERKITDFYNRIDKMKEAASIASNWTDKIVEG